MKFHIEPYQPHHLDAVVGLSLRAWAPVFVFIEQSMDPEIYRVFFPDWRVEQQQSVEGVCTGDENTVWVATAEDAVAGFVAVKLGMEGPMAEIYMVAVDPDYQGSGIGKALTDFAVERMREAGKTIAMVETGSDPGHAPARRLYETSGFRLFPVSRYFMKI